MAESMFPWWAWFYGCFQRASRVFPGTTQMDSGVVFVVVCCLCFGDWVILTVCLSDSESEQLEAARASSKLCCVGGTAGERCTSPYVRNTYFCWFLEGVFMCVCTHLWMAGEGVIPLRQSLSLNLELTVFSNRLANASITLSLLRHALFWPSWMFYVGAWGFELRSFS